MSRILKVIGGLQNFPLELLTDLCHDYYLILINPVDLPFAKASKCCLWVMDSCEILDEFHMKKKKSLCLPTCPAGIYTAQKVAFAIWGRDFAPRELPSLHVWHLKAFLRLYSVWSLFHFVNLHRHPRCPQPFSPWILNQSPFAQQQAVDFVCGNWLGENTRSCRQLCLRTQGEGVIVGFKDASFISLVGDEGEESV